MDVQEFVTRSVKDKGFMVEVFKYIPDEMLDEEVPESETGPAPGLARHLWPGAQAMGCTFSKDELRAECEKAVGGLGTFGTVKFVAQFAKCMSKAGKTKK